MKDPLCHTTMPKMMSNTTAMSVMRPVQQYQPSEPSCAFKGLRSLLNVCAKKQQNLNVL